MLQLLCPDASVIGRRPECKQRDAKLQLMTRFLDDHFPSKEVSKQGEMLKHAKRSSSGTAEKSSKINRQIAMSADSSPTVQHLMLIRIISCVHSLLRLPERHRHSIRGVRGELPVRQSLMTECALSPIGHVLWTHSLPLLLPLPLPINYPILVSRDPTSLPPKC